MENKISSYHLANNPDIYEPQREKNFDFIVTGLDNLVRADARDDDENRIIKNAQDILHFSVVSSTIPMFTQEPIKIKYGNSTINAAGAPTFSDGTLVINDFIGADGKSILMAWQNLSYNVREDTVGRMSDYKKTCYLQEYTSDYSRIVRTWKLIGCWVSGLSESEFSYENEGKKTISATITFDKAYMELPDEE